MAVERESSRFTTVFSWDSLSADIPPFPVIQSYDCGERGGGTLSPSFTPFPASMAVEGQEHSSLMTVDVQGHRDTLSRALRFSSLMLWLLIDRSTTVLRLSMYMDTLSQGSTPSSPPVSWLFERQEQSSLTTVEVQGQCTCCPRAFRLSCPPVSWLLRDRSTPVLRLSSCTDTPYPVLHP